MRGWPRPGIALLLASCCIALPAAADKITIDGSTGVMPLAAALSRAYQERYTGASFELGKGLGTKARLEALAEGRIDIALASHGIDAADLARRGMAAHEVARTAVVFGVNSSVKVAGLSAQQICDVYAGKVADWKTLGGPQLPIAARTRPDSEVDAEVARSGIACMKDLRMSEGVKLMPRSGDMARELAGTAGAIGMTTMTVVEQSGGAIVPLSIDSVMPSAANVERRVYPLLREAYLVVKLPPSAAVSRFVEFVKSDDGARVIRANGALPVR